MNALGEFQMVEVTPEASKYINDLIAKNNKQGYGIKIYLSGMGCSGPQFGMTFQQGKKDGDLEQQDDGFASILRRTRPRRSWTPVPSTSWRPPTAPV